MSILELFCSVDDFWQQFAPTWQQDLLTSGERQRVRPGQMYPSEMMTIVILFQQSHDRTFKAYYTEYVHRHLCSEFPTLVSDSRFVELMPTVQQLLVTQGLQLITKLRKKMHNRLLDWSDKLLLRKRAIIETITDQLKNICQIEHSRHRSPINFLVNLSAGLIAYCHQPKKPSLGVQLPTLAQG
jgi:hypothetical protein